MVKLVVVLHRRDGVSPDEFRRYWWERHAPLLRQLPGLRRLVFNYAQPDAAGAPPACDGISEDWFENMEALGAAFASPAGQAVATDAPNFVDMSRVQMSGSRGRGDDGWHAQPVGADDGSTQPDDIDLSPALDGSVRGGPPPAARWCHPLA